MMPAMGLMKLYGFMGMYTMIRMEKHPSGGGLSNKKYSGRNSFILLVKYLTHARSMESF